MASIWKRAKDRDNPHSAWLITYSERGRRRTLVGCPNYKDTLQIARKLESDAALRERGVLDPAAERLVVPDLNRAGIDPGSPAEGVVDFHSFRHGYVTALVRAGVSVKAAQRLARHSDSRLTLNTCTHLTLADERSALEQAFKVEQAPPLARNGTDDQSLLAIPAPRLAGTPAPRLALAGATSVPPKEPTKEDAAAPSERSAVVGAHRVNRR